MRVLIVWLVTAVAVAAAVWLVPGLEVVGSDAKGMISLIVFAAVLALLNSFIKPFLQLISLPISCITLGLFALVVNVIVLYLAVWIGNGLFHTGFHIDGFFSALLASIVISLVTAILNALIGVNNKGQPTQ
jgi:putative membrane protein